MSDYKPRFTNRYDVSMDGIYSLNLPNGTYKMIDDAFKRWQVRRGFITVEQQKKGLRGRAYNYGQFKNRLKNLEKEIIVEAAPKKIKTKKNVVKKKTVAKKKIKKVVKKK